ncbi:hypothetical protein GCM10008018_08420 [Paenibacillus marchantiophytorum]|uniref:Fe/B12 periplasmic-binding domain-containing protein n=1 Tax=Paenibacillus marchantiophytorum TaxID=1619310 RepID=A0ABQ2BTK8_9BACL|nr:ABC transporter substrate-binding protein [Paenibacillus marchantiophytorum]GGI44703.1 hypothetical protein GCM10008018_08420 [Paenibacillus marchantiophytorum]
MTNIFGQSMVPIEVEHSTIIGRKTERTAIGRAIGWLAPAILMVALTACSSVGNGTANRNGAQGAEGASISGTAKTAATVSPVAEQRTEVKTVKTMNGDIRIPLQPQRIVAEEYLGSLIPLGVIPVGAPSLILKNLYFKEALQKVADTGDYGKMNLEKIAQLNPDLILSSNSDNYAQLSKIAPTVIVPYGELKNAHEELTYFGQLLGKQKEAAAWLNDYDRRIALAKARVDKAVPAEATFSILEVTEKTIYTYGDNFGRGGQPVYQSLGRKPPAKVASTIMEKQWAELSPEMMVEYAGDYLVITSNSKTLEDFQKDPLWNSLPAFKNNHVYVWKEEHSWYYDPIAVLSQTEELAKWLAPISSK